jgi:hypothetical protein
MPEAIDSVASFSKADPLVKLVPIKAFQRPLSML